MEKVKLQAETTAEAFLELLALRGVEYFFANAGTDFVSIVEAFAKKRGEGTGLPRPVVVPHETPLVGMAYGYYLGTGRPQFAMVHVGVGTANGLGMLMAASRAEVPILFSAGRSPAEGEGRFSYVHWGQDLFDQPGIVREQVKWYGELKTPRQLEAFLDRAMTIALTPPMGPVYLVLPPEVLASPVDKREVAKDSPYDIPRVAPSKEKIEEAATLLAEAEFPLAITSSVGRSRQAVEALVTLSERLAMGVVSFNPEYMNFPTDHPHHLGFSPQPVIRRADLVLVVDCDVPWYPELLSPSDKAKVIHIGIDPLYNRYPARAFPSHLNIQGDPAEVLEGLLQALEGRNRRKIEKRGKVVRDLHEETFRQYALKAQEGASDVPLSPHWVSYQLKEVLGDEAIVVNEYDNGMRPFMSRLPGHYFCNPHAGYLGWGLGTALGLKLALPHKVIVATVGDGSYIFSVPTACHAVSAAYGLPLLNVVYNNRCWNAVRRATLALYPQGWAARAETCPLSELPLGHFEKVCEAFGGHGEMVQRPEELIPALERALKAVNGGRQALVNVLCRAV